MRHEQRPRDRDVQLFCWFPECSLIENSLKIERGIDLVSGDLFLKVNTLCELWFCGV